jgi:hypothetical protein
MGSEPKLPAREFGARYIAPLIFLAWLIALAMIPSLWLASAGLAWVVYFRVNRIGGQLVEAMAALHKDSRAERLAMGALLLKRPDPDDPEVKEMIEGLLKESRSLSPDESKTAT